MSGAGIYFVEPLVAKVEAFQVAGLELFFPSDDHPPPHFHVRKPGAWEIKLKINHQHRNEDLRYHPVRPKNPKSRRNRPTAHEAREIRAGVLGNRRALLREYRTKVK